MKHTSPCILYSRDAELVERMRRMTALLTTIQPIDTQNDLEQWISQFGDTVILADLRAPNCLEVLSQLRKSNPLSVIIVMGAKRSDPMLIAEWLEPFAKISLEPDRHELQSLLDHAFECLQLRKRNRILEAELSSAPANRNEGAPLSNSLVSAPLQNFSRAQRNVDNLDALFESVVDGLVSSARVSRAGIFVRSDAADDYVFRAGTRCLAATEKIVLSGNAPFVRWIETNTHLVSKNTLDNVTDPESREMLRQMLDALGAEILLPLYASGGIKGWIFVGQRATGIPFSIADLEELTGLADHISTTLEKAFQYEETALQKALAETVLHSIPFGIVACDEEAIIRWFNSTAHAILQPLDGPVIGQRIEALGSRVADMFRRSISNQIDHEVREWTDNRTRITLSAETRCLMDGRRCVGAMMMLRDITGAQLLKEKEDQVERAAFWNELASSMSHEIRNPLVAIKTFSQLLPKRYEDSDFRAEFSELVTAEVDKLNDIIDKINEFAHPPSPSFKPINIHKPIEHAVARLQSELDHENLKIHLSSNDFIGRVSGDSASLEECIYHLLMNAAENLDNKPGSRINVTVKGQAPETPGGNVYVLIADNGSGIDESVQDKVYSPFSTIKARGLGLGLPIAKRVVIDHNGRIDIDTSAGGTTITLVLPAIEETK